MILTVTIPKEMESRFSDKAVLDQKIKSFLRDLLSADECSKAKNTAAQSALQKVQQDCEAISVEIEG